MFPIFQCPLNFRPHICSPSEDGDVRFAAGVEWFSVPAAPTALLSQTRDPRHKIELTRPCVPLNNRTQAVCALRRYISEVADRDRNFVAIRLSSYLGNCRG